MEELDKDIDGELGDGYYWFRGLVAGSVMGLAASPFIGAATKQNILIEGKRENLINMFRQLGYDWWNGIDESYTHSNK